MFSSLSLATLAEILNKGRRGSRLAGQPAQPVSVASALERCFMILAKFLQGLLDSDLHATFYPINVILLGSQSMTVKRILSFDMAKILCQRSTTVAKEQTHIPGNGFQDGSKCIGFALKWYTYIKDVNCFMDGNFQIYNVKPKQSWARKINGRNEVILEAIGI